MKNVVIIGFDDHCWYKDYVNEVFDVLERRHPTFGYKEFILLDTKRNQEHFKNDELSLMCLRDGYMGVRREDVRRVETYDSVHQR